MSRSDYVFVSSVKWFEKPPRFLTGITLLWLAIFLVTFSDAGVPFPTWMGMSLALLVLSLVWMLRLGISIAYATDGRRHLRSHRRYWFSVPIIMFLSLAVGSSQMLLRARVFLSANALINTASTANNQARWVGLFYVREFSQFGEELRFITNECGLVDQCGIVFAPMGRPPNRGEDSFNHLYGPWWHWYQSW